MKVLMFRSNACTADPRVYNEASSLIEAGHEVTVIAWDMGREHPPRQNWDGIEIIRVRTRLALRYGFAHWLWNGCNMLLWWQGAYRRALVLHRQKSFEVIHCNDLDTLAIGTRLKRKLGIPLIYDAYEIYGYMMAGNLPRLIVRIIFWLEKRLLGKVDRVIVTSEPQRRYFESIADKPITIIMNCKRLQRLEYQAPHNDDFTVLYIGGLYQARAVPMLVRVAKDLPGVRCIIGGIGRPAYVQMLVEECSKTSNVSFLGRVPLDEVIPMTMKADAVFCMFDPGDPMHLIGSPNKLFEAMACGRPIICTRGTHSGEVTEQEDVGLAVEYTEQALREAIIRLRDDPALRERLGRRGLRAAIDKYNWEKQEEKLLKLYESVKVNSEQQTVNGEQ